MDRSIDPLGFWGGSVAKPIHKGYTGRGAGVDDPQL